MIVSVVDDLSRRLVTDELWALAQPLIPGFDPRPQGGGTTPVDDRAVFTAIVFVLTSGCAWRYLPPSFGVTVATAHRRFTDWTKAGLRRRAASRGARRVMQPRPDRLVPRGSRRSVGQGQKGDRLAAPGSGRTGGHRLGHSFAVPAVMKNVTVKRIGFSSRPDRIEPRRHRPVQ